MLAGRGFGKTRVGAEWVREQVKTYKRVNLVGKDAADMRSVMIEGESGILNICPRWERPVYRASKRLLEWPNGAISELRTGEDPEGLRGLQSDALWADELCAWQYPEEAWDMAIFGLRLGSSQACITTTPKPIRALKELLVSPLTVVTKGTTYDNLENLSPVFGEIIRRYEGTRLGRQELLAEVLLDEGLAYRFSERTHTIVPFEVPPSWERFESMDFGSTNPTAWLVYAVDHDGNIVVFDEFYEPGYPSETAPRIKLLRERRWHSSVCYADPSVFDNKSVTNRWGQPATVSNEFLEHGIGLNGANRDRVAGYVRIAELLRVREGVRRPEWAGPGEGSPSLFIFDRCKNLIEQLKDAPLEEEGEPHPGEAVSRRWEGPHGHAHAALRYGVMSWPGPSERVNTPDLSHLDDRSRGLSELLIKHERRIEQGEARPGRYTNV